MNDISAIIVAKDNPHYLLSTISSIQDFVKEIIVADIGVDQLLIGKLKKYKKISVIKIGENVPYVEVVREELKKYASGKYLLFLDPDEVMPKELIRILQPIYQKYSYIQIPRKNIIFGKWIQHSRWWPDYQVRLFRKESVIWPEEIHKQPIAKGNGYTVGPEEKYAITHHNYESVDEFMNKAIRYAKSEAYDLSSFSLTEALRKALSEFISRYFGDEGYKDGMHGFTLSFLQMFYYFLVYAYYWEKKKYQEDSNESIHQNIYIFFKNGLHETTHWLIQKKLITGFKKVKAKVYNSLSKLT